MDGAFFLLFLLITAGAGAVVATPALIAARRGRPRAAGLLLVASGLLFVIAGFLLFAPQPLWIGALLVAFGAVLLGRPRNTQIGSRG